MTTQPQITGYRLAQREKTKQLIAEMAAKKRLDAGALRQRLSYDPESGVFTWLLGRRAGLRAGRIIHHGYRIIGVMGRGRLEHRLAWLYHYGEWPASNVDHINGDTGDNRIVNLRLANQSQNVANSRLHKDSKSGIKGAHYDARRNKWRARICIDRKPLWLGYFNTAEEAAAAYQAAAEKAWGEFARPA